MKNLNARFRGHDNMQLNQRFLILLRTRLMGTCHGPRLTVFDLLITDHR